MSKVESQVSCIHSRTNILVFVVMFDVVNKSFFLNMQVTKYIN